MTIRTPKLISIIRGSAYQSVLDYVLAVLNFDEAIDLDPQYALAYYNRGISYYNIGNRNQAISDLVRALELGLSPDFEQEARALLEDLGQ